MAEHREFFYRRLHSLLGVIPIGVFLIQHLVVNHFAVYGEESFNKAAGFMHDLPFRLALEIVIIFLPIFISCNTRGLHCICRKEQYKTIWLFP